MLELIETILNSDERNILHQFMQEIKATSQLYWLREDIVRVFTSFCQGKESQRTDLPLSPLERLIRYTQEIIVDRDRLYWVYRSQKVQQEAYCIQEDLTLKPLTVSELLSARDQVVNGFHPQDGAPWEIDLSCFYDYSPLLPDVKNIGESAKFLNRFLASQLWQFSAQQESLYHFLSQQHYNDTPLLLNETIVNILHLKKALKKALKFLKEIPPNTLYQDFQIELQKLGFEPGWGNTASRTQETLEILQEVVTAPNDIILETFLARLPLIFRIVLVSVHGWFAQKDVLGRPDTGGQVVYVLDQAISLEKQLQEQIILAGLDQLGIKPKVIILTRLIPESEGTRCNLRLEKIEETENSWILRVPFRSFNPKISDRWISRFEIWPYLETYAIDAEQELYQEFQGKPDLIIGNYSDGNLVSFLLSRRLHTVQLNIAHALEKSKYKASDIYWEKLEPNYHFSLQFTADLIAMNAASGIISSTYQEIIGTDEGPGQYECYECFTLPNLYQVVHGIELSLPKFNVIPPGVNEKVFFPYTRTADRKIKKMKQLEELLFSSNDRLLVFGKLDDPQKRPIFSMARLDKIKNLTGLTECFGRSPALQERCNLILIAGNLSVEMSNDSEEKAEIEKLYQIIDKFDLQGKIRWLGVRLPKEESGEVYRIIADRQGIFVQPALLEAFGLTVLEAMVSGLPTFATQFGGPSEIIQDGHNGFLINPTDLEAMATKILGFVDWCDRNHHYWSEISNYSIERVYSSYTWQIHTSKVLSIAHLYKFWNFNTRDQREDLWRYLESLYHGLYKPRAKALLAEHLER